MPTKAGVRKPPGNESAGGGALGSAGSMGIWLARTAQHARKMWAVMVIVSAGGHVEAESEVARWWIAGRSGVTSSRCGSMEPRGSCSLALLGY